MEVYEFARSATTKYHGLGGFNSGNFSHIVEGRRPRRVSMGLPSSEASFLGSSDGHFPVSSHGLSSVCVCAHVCVQMSTSCKDTSHTELVPTLMSSFHLITSLKTLCPKKVGFRGTRG